MISVATILSYIFFKEKISTYVNGLKNNHLKIYLASTVSLFFLKVTGESIFYEKYNLFLDDFNKFCIKFPLMVISIVGTYSIKKWLEKVQRIVNWPIC